MEVPIRRPRARSAGKRGENVILTATSPGSSPSGAAPPGELYICTWLYADSADEDATHYQVRGRSSSERFQATFWRCVALFFATSVRQQPEARHVLFTNATTPPVVDGVAIGSLLGSLDVEIVQLPLTYRTPPGYYAQWRNQFYVFDILQYLDRRLEPSDAAIVLDSDCVWISHAAPMWEAIRRDGALTYVVTYEPAYATNGLTRVELSAIASELLGREVRHPLLYCGGELLGASATEIRRLAHETDTVWKELLERHSRGAAVFHEEGHTLSYVYFKLGYPLGNGDPFIRRIYTDSLRRSANNASPHDHGLIVWHVLLEKRLGIKRLFPSTTEGTSPLWALDDDEFRSYLGSMLGIPRSRMTKRLRDLVRRVVEKVRG
jgi:hypothetical protein